MHRKQVQLALLLYQYLFCIQGTDKDLLSIRCLALPTNHFLHSRIGDISANP